MLALLTTGSLTVRDIFKPESMALNLSERDSTASITLGPDGPELALGDWLQDLTEPGKGIVWRVRNIDTQHDTETRNITLEHMIYSLADRIIPTEITPETMGGTSAGVSAETAAAYVLNYQSIWQLGDFGYSESHPYKFDGDTLKAALETITGSLADPIWEYDFSSYPFTLNIRQLSNDVGSELRAGRNITTLKYSVDRSRMFTRFYPRGKNNLKITGEYVSKNENLYGRIDKTETDSSKETEAELIDWSNDRLNRHAHPNVTVSISGLDLSKATGETLDKLKIGKRCQVPLPDENALISEKVTNLRWRDKIRDPESVTVTLANAVEDVQSIIKQEQQKSSGGGRAAAKADEENMIVIGETVSGVYTYIIQTSTNIIQHVHDTLQGYSTIEQTATAITAAVTDASTQNWSMIQQTATGIMSQVHTELQGYSTIEQTASQITLAVASGQSDIYTSIITQTSTDIQLAVSNAESGLYGAINVQANRISLVVQGSGANARIKPAEIVAAINNGASTIKLSADHIDIDGLVTSLEAVDVMVQNFNAADGEFTGDLSVLGELSAYSVGSIAGHNVSWKSANIITYTLGTYRYYLYGTSASSTTASGATGMYPVTGNNTTTIYYLGHS